MKWELKNNTPHYMKVIKLHPSTEKDYCTSINSSKEWTEYIVELGLNSGTNRN